MTAKPRILLVDDEEMILSSLKRLLRKEPYVVKATTSIPEALELLASKEFAVVVSDQRMPEMMGAELLERACDLCPETVRIILTGFQDINAAVASVNRGRVFRFLTKPWEDDVLKSVLREAVEQQGIRRENERLTSLTLQQNEELQELNATLESRVERRTQQIATLNTRLQESFLGSIEVLAKLAEMYSPVLGNHARRVATVSKMLGRRLGMDDAELEQLEIAGLLHDIGKIGISAEVLAGRSPRHREQRESHVVRGEAIVQMMPNQEAVARFVRHHHEQFNGRGYPDRLQGDQIPLGARVLAVVDAYDIALHSQGTFREATAATALADVQRRTPRHFDPDIVKALAQAVETGESMVEDQIEVKLSDLKAGMVLSVDVKSNGQLLLLPAETELNEPAIRKLNAYNESDPITAPIFIYRRAEETEDVPS